MTRKDFILIAETIRTMSLNDVDRAYVAHEFADTLTTTNANFKRDTFLKACGV